MRSQAILSARTDMLRGLANGEVRLAYQPQIDLATGAITGFEAVVRWDHPQLGLMIPGLFLGLVAREGLSGLMTRTLLSQAGEVVADWRGRGFPVTVGLNLARADLTDPTLAADAPATLRAIGASPEWLVLEAGEEALASCGEPGFATLEALRVAGFQIALDARGPPAIALDTRGRSLFCQLKCGGTTLLRVARRLQLMDASLFARRIAAARAAGLPLIAVGAETEGVVSLLRSFGFDQVQGNAFSPPVPAADALALLLGHPVTANPILPLPFVPLPRPGASAPSLPPGGRGTGLRLRGVEIVGPPEDRRIAEPEVPADDRLSVWG